jgi:hypothetical protein
MGQGKRAFAKLLHAATSRKSTAKLIGKVREICGNLTITPLVSFETARLLLRAAQRDHAAVLFEKYIGREVAARYLLRRAHPSLARTQAVIEACGEENWSTSKRFAWLASGGVLPFNSASAVRGHKHVVKRGKTPVVGWHFGVRFLIE